MNGNLTIVSEANDVERAIFYKKTYLHVAIALLSFMVVEGVLLRIVPQEFILQMMGGRLIWLFIIGLFWLGSVLANRFAFSLDRNMQYLGLGLYILIEAIIFLPVLYLALVMTDGAAVVQQAAVLTLFMFGGLTAVVFMTNKDFSFLRSAIVIGGFVALGLIVAGAIFGFNLGLWFSVAMVALAAGSILYQTSQIKNNYATGQYVGAALQLFASIMLLFWYILRILMSRK
ncbi:Bax inhibitor-1/YccA family protein [Niabella insulamsoli]|uniref:Bax inhibitor-1/YccA family protein n=1 Tax=Niabella insulamsoli TaxID=3144874 RepID=UPI0031FC9906